MSQEFTDAPFRSRVMANYYPRSHDLRGRVNAFLGNCGQHNHSHFCFDYFYVPEHYAYLRASAERVLGHDLYEDLHNQLIATAQALGMRTATRAYLSVYVNGMGQGTHSDALNGSIGYVYSLTHWDRRKFTGGETLVARPYVFDDLRRDHKGVTSYWDAFPAHFNQLLLFDDRIAHCVPFVAGPMDPLEGRLVIHGHMH